MSQNFLLLRTLRYLLKELFLLIRKLGILNCRRAMEFAVKWMYSVDVELEMPYQDNLQSLMNVGEYRQIVGSDIWKEWIISADVEIM